MRVRINARASVRGLVIAALPGALAIATAGGSLRAAPGTTEPADEPVSAESPVGACTIDDDLIAAAQAEGVVVMYNSPGGIDGPITAGFSAAYGIEVQATRMPSPDLKARYSAEIEAGSPTADLIISADDGYFEDALANGWILPLAEELPGFPGDYPELFVREAHAVVQTTPFGFAYNTDLFDESDVPEDWAGFTDPTLAGEIGLADPNDSAYYTAFYDYFAGELGEEWLTGLAALDLQVAGGASQTIQAVAAGEYAIALPSSAGYTDEPISQGAPLALVVPAVTTTLPAAVALTADPAHPAAAQLLACWLLAPEGNKVVADARGTLDMFQPEVLGYQVPPIPSPERQAEIIGILTGS